MSGQFGWRGGLMLLGLTLAHGCADPIVGAECRDGYTVCNGECVRLDTDFRHCGACGNDCGFFVCDEGTCSTTDLRPDAGLGDGGVLPGTDGGVLPGTDGGVPRDGSVQVPDARVSADSGVSGCGLGQISCDDGCVNPNQNPQHCGGCDQACDPDEFCAAGICEPSCEAPLVPCAGACIDVVADPRNCGGCGNVCESGICVGGECADAVPGHLVVIGHDYQSSTEVMRRVAANAVFLAPGAPVRVLSYLGGASTSSVNNIRSILDTNVEGRSWQEIEGLEPIITQQLATADVFLVYPQSSAANSVLDKLGDQWGNALAQFMLAGGVVVLFETPADGNDGTYRILQPAGLFAAASRANVPNQVLTVVEPGVGLAHNLTASYRSAQRTSRFVGVSTPGSVVVEAGDGSPVVYHRVVR